MKRTRRISVISYSRRVTVIEGYDSPARSSTVDDLPAIDVIPFATEDVDPRTTTIDVAKKRSPPQPARRLRDLWRLGR
jgi:hypothetical protein